MSSTNLRKTREARELRHPTKQTQRVDSFESKRHVYVHSFWDDVITRSDRLPVLQKLATFLRTRQEFAKPSLTELATTDFEGWANETFRGAIAVAYAGGTMTGAPEESEARLPRSSSSPRADVGLHSHR
jgi:hypothetical protein